jgi:hypothetical protein
MLASLLSSAAPEAPVLVAYPCARFRAARFVLAVLKALIFPLTSLSTEVSSLCSKSTSSPMGRSDR